MKQSDGVKAVDDCDPVGRQTGRVNAASAVPKKRRDYHLSQAHHRAVLTEPVSQGLTEVIMGIRLRLFRLHQNLGNIYRKQFGLSQKFPITVTENCP